MGFRTFVLCASSSAVTLLAVRLWDWYISPHLWKKKMRQLAFESGEPAVVDVSPTNVAAFRRGGVALIVKDLRASDLPPHVVEYVGQLLIARGADQAFRTKTELVNFKKVAQHLQKQLEEIESNLSVFAAIAYCDPANPGASDKEARKIAAKLAKELDECRGCLHAVRETRTWTAAICKVARFPSSSRMFIASDGAIALLPPEMSSPGGLAHRVAAFKAAVDAGTPGIMAAIEQHGWPPKYTYSGGAGGKHKCKHCQGMFGGKWIRAASCWKCRFELRARGACPYGAFDGGHLCAVCPHQHRCLRCEQASCAACGVLHSADLDEGVRGLLEDLQPAWLFLDFDQTLSESKSGASPVLGKHGLNPELVEAARRRRSGVMVITKQSAANQAAIEAFLAAAGLGHVPVRCLGGQRGREKTTKADVMREVLASVTESVTANADPGGPGEARPAAATGSGDVADVTAGEARRGGGGGAPSGEGKAVTAVTGAGRVGVFVDDDAREVLDPAVAALPVMRVLFVSGSWEARPTAPPSSC